jgi:hypothetical protein
MSLQFIRLRAESDGNCFFHSLAKLVCLDWKFDDSRFLRQAVAERFDINCYLLLENGLTATVNILARQQFKHLDRVDLLINKPEIKEALVEDFKRYKSALADPRVWAEEWMIAACSAILGINIFVLTSDDIWISPSALQVGRPVAFIYNWREAHYDPLMLRENATTYKTVAWDKAKAITDLIK